MNSLWPHYHPSLVRAWSPRFAALILALPIAAVAATYYLDNQNGNDANNGLAASTAWQTVDRVNQQAYAPGDAILLRRGGQWHGTGFKANGSGTANAPILLADYGDLSLPLPLIDGVGPHEAAVLLQNVQNWTVRNLELTQHGQTPQDLDVQKGKDADQYSDTYMRAVVHVLALGALNDSNCGEGCTVRNIRLENLVVHDGSWTGIYVSGGYYQLKSAQYGFVDNVSIQQVDSSYNDKAGIEITCTYYLDRIYATSNVWVLDSHLHHNGGDGAMVGPVLNGLLDGNLCAYNGTRRNARVGCWTWDSQNTVIQFNESHHNMTPLTDGTARDGAGFDLDLGTEDGIIQYNWSHDNQGEGFLFVSWPVGYGYSRGVSHNAQMRYNLSERDGKKLAGGISVFGGVSPLVLYNNTIYYEPDRLAGTPMFNGEGGALTTSIWGKSGKPDMRVYNNVFISNGRSNSAAVSNNLWTDGSGTFTFDNNVWWRVEGGVSFQWAGAVMTTWSSWQANAFDPSGRNADPRVAGILGAGPSAYFLAPGSPAIDLGRAVTDALRGMGLQDGTGASIPQGAAFDTGAYEYRYVVPDPASPRISGLMQQPDGSWRLEVAGAAGRNYSAQTSPDFRTWQPLGTAAEVASGKYVVSDPTENSHRFYRALSRGIPGL
jgi:hypothetical protein